jgi:hypothetical protein
VHAAPAVLRNPRRFIISPGVMAEFKHRPEFHASLQFANRQSLANRLRNTQLVSAG